MKRGREPRRGIEAVVNADFASTLHPEAQSAMLRAFVEHVLFVRNQVPVPVVQLDALVSGGDAQHGENGEGLPRRRPPAGSLRLMRSVEAIQTLGSLLEAACGYFGSRLREAVIMLGASQRSAREVWRLRFPQNGDAEADVTAFPGAAGAAADVTASAAAAAGGAAAAVTCGEGKQQQQQERQQQQQQQEPQQQQQEPQQQQQEEEQQEPPRPRPDLFVRKLLRTVVSETCMLPLPVLSPCRLHVFLLGRDPPPAAAAAAPAAAAAVPLPPPPPPPLPPYLRVVSGFQLCISKTRPQPQITVIASSTAAAATAATAASAAGAAAGEAAPSDGMEEEERDAIELPMERWYAVVGPRVQGFRKAQRGPV